MKEGEKAKWKWLEDARGYEYAQFKDINSPKVYTYSLPKESIKYMTKGLLALLRIIWEVPAPNSKTKDKQEE